MSTVLSKSSSDLYQAITAKIVAAIEAGAGEYKMPWHGGLVPPAFPVNAATDRPYRGVNIVSLWVEAHVRRYLSGYWASYRQWQQIGAQVRKGERGSLILFYKPLDQEAAEENDGEKARLRFVARASYVFNAEQVNDWQPPVPKLKSEVEINESFAAFIRATGAEIRHGSSIACYDRNLDCILMPNPEAFIGTATSSPTEAYHSVLGHEAIHWSGGPSRLNREFGKRMSDPVYAAEELIAELGAAFLCSAFRIANEPRPDHAAYVSSWLDLLNRNTRAIFTAASKAQEAVEYLCDLAKPASG